MTCTNPDQYDARQDEFRIKLLYYEFQKYEVMTMSLVDVQQKKHANPSYKTTKHIKCTFLISDYYKFTVTKHIKCTFLISDYYKFTV